MEQRYTHTYIYNDDGAFSENVNGSEVVHVSKTGSLKCLEYSYCPAEKWSFHLVAILI